jgi:hypothetical protein
VNRTPKSKPGCDDLPRFHKTTTCLYSFGPSTIAASICRLPPVANPSRRDDCILNQHHVLTGINTMLVFRSLPPVVPDCLKAWLPRHHILLLQLLQGKLLLLTTYTTPYETLVSFKTHPVHVFGLPLK